MKKRNLFVFLLAIILTITISGCSIGSIGFVGDKSNYSVNNSMSNGIATSLSSINKTPITSETLDREDDSDTILTKNRQSVVEIYTVFDGGAGGASGVIIGHYPYAEAKLSGEIGIAYVLTCHHVIESAYYANVRDIYGNVMPAGLIGSNPSGDTAVLWMEVKQVPSVAKFASSSEVQVGETVYAIGNPTSMLGGTVTRGIISALSRELLIGNQYIELLQIDAAINGGSSGGGLFTEDGYLIGMTNSGYEGKDGLGFAVPSDSILSDVNNLISTYNDAEYGTYGYIPNKASVGVSLGVGSKEGVIIGLTDTGSWKNSGVEVGDKIVSATFGEEVYTFVSSSEFLQYLGTKNLNVGDTYVLTVIRAGETIDVTVTVKQLIYIPPVLPMESQVLETGESVSVENVSQEPFVCPFLDSFSAPDLEVVLAKTMYIGQIKNDIDKTNISNFDLVREDDSNSILTQNRKSVVEVYSTYSEISGGAGSGVIIDFKPFSDKDGGIAYVVTNHHVIDGAYYVNIKDMFGEKLYPAALIGSNEYSDIAVMYAELDYTPSVAKFCDSSKIQVGNEVYAIGNPMGTLGGTVSKGIVSALNRMSIMDGFAMELMQVDSALNNGSSGGGIFTEEGLLVAIANSGIPSQDGLGFAIPANDVLYVVNSLISTYNDEVYHNYGYVKDSINLGISVGNYGNQVWPNGANKNHQIVQITEARVNGAFAKAGIRAGDLIYSIKYKGENVVIQNAGYLLMNLYLLNLTAGDTLTVEVCRNSSILTIEVLLEQYIYVPPIN